jgi:hypothetical protein
MPLPYLHLRNAFAVGVLMGSSRSFKLAALSVRVSPSQVMEIRTKRGSCRAVTMFPSSLITSQNLTFSKHRICVDHQERQPKSVSELQLYTVILYFLPVCHVCVCVPLCVCVCVCLSVLNISSKQDWSCQSTQKDDQPLKHPTYSMWNIWAPWKHRNQKLLIIFILIARKPGHLH